MDIRLYSRNLDDVSYMYPDLVNLIKKHIKAKSIIFEGEAVGYNPKTGSLLPFQETVQRKRKYGIDKMVKKIPLKLFAFDILYINGRSLLNTPFSKRREILSSVIAGLLTADDRQVTEASEIDFLFNKAVKEGLEGIVVKKLDGIYQAGARGWNWIKYKRSYSEKIEDTIDCLIMGYDFGKGKRTHFGLGAFLVGVYDEKNDQFVTVAKVGTGLKDEEWKSLYKKIEEGKFQRQKKPALYKVDKALECDMWVNPSIIVEIRADEITKSPVHTARFALRFPRLERFRDDKRPEEVTTLKEIEKMYGRYKS